jgi:flagellin
MSIYVNTNAQSVFTQRALSQNTNGLQKNIERLSTGLRINRAADDAAGLSISEKLTSQIRGLEKAQQNIGDGVSMLQTAEASLSIVQDNLQRVRELVVQGFNGTNGTSELDALQREINERITVIGEISSATKFNSISLLDGSADITLQTGADNGQTTTISLQSGQSANTGIAVDVAFEYNATTPATARGTLIEGITVNGFALDKLQLDGASVDSVDGVQNFSIVAGTAATDEVDLDDIDTIINNVSRMRSELGAFQNSLESKNEYLAVAKENALSARSRVLDADISKESSGFIRNQILQQSSAAMLSQANSSPQIALNLLP